MDQMTDEALLLRFASGDQNAAPALTDRLAPRAFRLALRVSGNEADAEEITQDAMLRLWQNAANWDGGGAKPSTWLYRVVLNLSIDRQRRSRRFTVGLDAVDDPIDDAPAASEVVQNASRNDALQQALMELPTRQRQAVVLRHFDGLSNGEIAEVLEIGIEAVESLTARGKRALATRLVGRRAELGYEI
jgi:RNA polymerase sigma-70 factor (ECF subfamily)